MRQVFSHTPALAERSSVPGTNPYRVIEPIRALRKELGLTPKCSESGTAEVPNGGVNLPLAATRLCEAPLLTRKQEELLFKRMNFLLYYASINRASLSVVPPSTELIELIERLVALSEWHRDRILEANLRLVFSIVKKYVMMRTHSLDVFIKATQELFSPSISRKLNQQFH